ncbi:MAG: NAD(+)/NADH kinase [Lachnospiraceae bacterium]|nr:NAD(+)/NADH kinase [Lachnospiraceae bacterium]MDY5742326.1 NAD(+)/NADH kinase [Lachnospiraceae bacterium]
MKKICMIINRDKDPDDSIRKELQDYLRGLGVESICVEMEELAGLKAENMEFILALGGDGTFIRAARAVLGKNIPIAGYNIGTLGFLAEIDRNNRDVLMKRLVDGQYRVETRMMLEGRLYREENGRYEPSGIGIALNDIAIHRVSNPHILQMEIYVNGASLTTYNADGTVIASPTGSTAYNLSAGGPIVDPRAKLMIITPIAAHTLNSRSIVLSAEDEIEIHLAKRNVNDRPQAQILFDGNETYSIDGHYKLAIRRSQYETKVVKIDDTSFLEVVRRKMTST